MRTQVMQDPTADIPWLEHFANGKSQPERAQIETFPFMIGRVEAADFQINSSRVSREHAVIDRRGGEYSIRDQGSTNGTFVNGNRIEEVPLQDGDAIMIADVELSFHQGITAGRCVTQVMTGSEPAEVEATGGEHVAPRSELVGEVRQYQEMLIQRAAHCRFQRILDLRTGEVFGFEALTRGTAGQEESRVERLLNATECRLTERLQELRRLWAAEQAVQLDKETHLFFNLQTAEVGAEWLPRSLERLRQALTDRHRIVVEIPDSAVCDIPFFRTFLATLREMRMLVAYDGFNGSESQVGDLGEIAPDFLKLSPTLVRGIGRSSGGQRQVQAIVRAAHELEFDIVATGVQNEDEVEIFRDLGCRFAQGDLYGSSTTMFASQGATPAI